MRRKNKKLSDEDQETPARKPTMVAILCMIFKIKENILLIFIQNVNTLVKEKKRMIINT